MDYRAEFSKRLILLREQRGITQQELADQLEITRQSLSLYEKAERTINIELLAKIADFFNVTTDYLMGRTDISSMEANIQTACEVTGLSEEAVFTLFSRSVFEDDLFKPINFILEMHTIFGETENDKDLLFYLCLYLNMNNDIDEKFTLTYRGNLSFDNEILGGDNSKTHFLDLMPALLLSKNDIVENILSSKILELLKNYKKAYHEKYLKEREQDADNNKEG